ncbi:MAG: DUF2953 domain-containing protein [Butyrivibrio sp.]|nr:DUF2953 domain-containing protein [Butyrivibrio sp.]
MLSIVLTVLKVIGIVLLIILGIIILLLLLILFVPIRYRLDASCEEKLLDAENVDFTKGVTASFSFSYLLSLLNGGFSYPDRPYFRIRILFFELFSTQAEGKTEETSDSEKTSDSEETNIEAMEADSNLEDPDLDAKEEDIISENTESAAKEQDISCESKDVGTEAEIEAEQALGFSDNCQSFEENNDEESGNIPGFIGFIQSIIEKAKIFITTQQNVFNKIKCTISRVYGKINMIKSTLENDIFQRAFEKSKKHLGIILKSILPRKVVADILYGTGDPAMTAQIMGGLGIVRALGFNKITLRPDFDRTVIQGNLHIKGRITLFRIVLSLAICYFNKDIRKTVKRFNKILNS